MDGPGPGSFQSRPSTHTVSSSEFGGAPELTVDVTRGTLRVDAGWFYPSDL
jgi:hypothetical protein